MLHQKQGSGSDEMARRQGESKKPAATPAFFTICALSLSVPVPEVDVRRSCV